MRRHRPTDRIRTRAAPLALPLALTAAIGLWTGCGPGGPGGERALQPAEFVDIVVSLREAERAAQATDSAQAEFQRRRDEILGEWGVTEEDLRTFVRRHHSDFRLMSRIWDTIAQRLRHVPEPALEAPPREPGIPLIIEDRG